MKQWQVLCTLALLTIPGYVLTADKLPTIILERRGCEGLCPVYTVTFSTDSVGKIFFAQWNHTGKKDTSYFIDRDSVEELYKKIKEIDFSAMNDQYIGDGTYDLETTRITISKKTITFNGLFLLKHHLILDTLSAMIDRIAMTDKVIDRRF
jgi:hypothetical protein